VNALICLFWRSKSKKKIKEQKKNKEEFIPKLLNEYGLTFSDVSIYFCKYVGGHPDRDKESFDNVLLGIKNEKLIFFEAKSIYFKEGIWPKEGSILNKEIEVHEYSEFIHLFDIPVVGYTWV